MNDESEYDSPYQVGSVPPIGKPNLDPDGDDGRGLTGPEETEDEIDDEVRRMLREGDLDRCDQRHYYRS